ncbi:MAG TPA: cyclase family protein [Candidatus Acidoferrales bacterium]|nr:cyclase family protein [Candidatus Acidoferrales bacterium]
MRILSALARGIIFAVVMALAVSLGAQTKKSDGICSALTGISSGRTRVVDMTYALNDHTPAWPGDAHPFEAVTNASPAKEGYFTRKITMLEHYGTHMDAPAHFPPGKETLDQIPVQRFFGPAVVIDIRDKDAKNVDYRLSVADVQAWEARHGKIPAGAIVMLRTGWGSRWPDQMRYRNMDAKNVMHFPGYSVAAAKFLIARRVSGLCIDTLSIDYGPSANFEVHRTTLPAGLFHIENIANVDKLPAAGAFVIAAPIKLEGGSGGPVRVFAILPN